MQPKEQKLYVLIRSDLSEPYQAVQAGHAVAQYLIEHPDTSWKNGTLVYLAVRDEEELAFWGDKLTWRGVSWTGFREPDIGNEMTAIACVTNGNVFSKLSLVGK